MCQLAPASKQDPCWGCTPAGGEVTLQPRGVGVPSPTGLIPNPASAAHPLAATGQVPPHHLQNGGDLSGPWQRGRTGRVRAHSRSAAGQDAPWKSCLLLPKTAQLGGAPGPSMFPTRGAGVLWDVLSNTGHAGGLRAKGGEITADGEGGGFLPPPRFPLCARLSPVPVGSGRHPWLTLDLCSFTFTGLPSLLPALPPPGHPSSLLPQESAQGPPGSALHLHPAQSPALNGGPFWACSSTASSLGTSPLAPAWPTLLSPLLSVGLTLTSLTQGVCPLSSEGDLTAPPPHAAHPFLLCDTCCILPAHPAHGCSLSVSPAVLGAHKRRGLALLCSLPKIGKDT